MLPRIRNGDVDFVLGFTEPETGSDLANLQTRAHRDGDEYVINGQKMYGNPGPDDMMYLAVRTDPDAPLRRGISVLLVEYGREGFTATKMPTLAGSTVGATYYDDVRVPADHLLGEENKGWDYIREALDLDRTSGITYGHLPLRLEELIEYVKASTLGGRPLIDDPWVRDRIAQFVIEVEAGELLQGDDGVEDRRRAAAAHGVLGGEGVPDGDGAPHGGVRDGGVGAAGLAHAGVGAGARRAGSSTGRTATTRASRSRAAATRSSATSSRSRDSGSLRG